MVSAEHNFINEDLHLPHNPQAFFSCFGQDAALKNPWNMLGSVRFGKNINCFE